MTQEKGSGIVYKSRQKFTMLLVILWGLVIVSALTGYVAGMILFGVCAVLITYPLFRKDVKIEFRNEQREKSFDEILKDEGVFVYGDDGFSITLDGKAHNVLWTDILSMFGYKLDMFTTDEICLDVFCKNNFVFTISESVSGWHVFLQKSSARFSGIDQAWEFKIMTPAFKRNQTLIYECENRNLKEALVLYYK